MKTYSGQCSICEKSFKSERANPKTCGKSCRGRAGGLGNRKSSVEERFWKRVWIGGEDDCWPWRKKLNDAGYGIFSDGSVASRAHRVSWTIKHGPIPSGLIVRHRCDIRSCVNPAHLELGTQADNVNDMMDRKRHGSRKRTHCRRGHEVTGPCVPCARIRSRKWAAKNKLGGLNGSR